MKYKVMFDYSIPQFTDVDVIAAERGEAEILAWAVFNDTYPEAVDAEVVEVQLQDA